MNLKKIYRFAVKNYFIIIFFVIVGFVGFVSLIKLFYSKSTYLYAKVKLGQGFWWATTAKPSIWFVNALKKGEIEKNLLGRPIAKILNIRHYPSSTLSSGQLNNQYDIFVTVVITVSGDKKSDKYIFKRSAIGVGSPIDFEFPSSQISGTIIALSENNFKDNFIEKTITLTKKFSYPWEFEAIKVGDSFFDGEDTVFEVLDKSASNTSIISSDLYGNINPNINEGRKYITVKAKIKLKQNADQLIFGEEQVISPGSQIIVSTPHFTFDNFFIAGLE